MGLRMQNFNMLGVHWKNLTFKGGGSSQETDIEGGFPKKGELGQFADLRGVLTRKRTWCFWGVGVDTLMHTMKDLASSLQFHIKVC